MRNPNSHRFERYGQMPHTTSSSGRQNHTPTSSSKMPDVVVENMDRGRNDYHSDRHHHHHHHGGHGSQGNHITSGSNHVQPTMLSMDDSIGASPTASNPNRSEIPPKRKGSFDPVCYHYYIVHVFGWHLFVYFYRCCCCCCL